MFKVRQTVKVIATNSQLLSLFILPISGCLATIKQVNENCFYNDDYWDMWIELLDGRYVGRTQGMMRDYIKVIGEPE